MTVPIFRPCVAFVNVCSRVFDCCMIPRISEVEQYLVNMSMLCELACLRNTIDVIADVIAQAYCIFCRIIYSKLKKS